jgi:hypothetical protein
MPPVNFCCPLVGALVKIFLTFAKTFAFRDWQACKTAEEALARVKETERIIA